MTTPLQDPWLPLEVGRNLQQMRHGPAGANQQLGGRGQGRDGVLVSLIYLVTATGGSWSHPSTAQAGEVRLAPVEVTVGQSGDTENWDVRNLPGLGWGFVVSVWLQGCSTVPSLVGLQLQHPFAARTAPCHLSHFQKASRSRAKVRACHGLHEQWISIRNFLISISNGFLLLSAPIPSPEAECLPSAEMSSQLSLPTVPSQAFPPQSENILLLMKNKTSTHGLLLFAEPLSGTKTPS